MCCAAGVAQAMECTADELGLGILNCLHCSRFPNLLKASGGVPPRQALGKGHADQWAGNGEQEIRYTLGQNLISKFQSSYEWKVLLFPKHWARLVLLQQPPKRTQNHPLGNSRRHDSSFLLLVLWENTSSSAQEQHSSSSPGKQ